MKPSTVSLEVESDTLAPTISIDSPLAVITQNNWDSYPLAGSCSEASREVMIYMGSTQKGTISCKANNRWDVSINLGPGGSYEDRVNWMARHTDAANNSTDSAVVSVDRDTSAPSIQIRRTSNGLAQTASWSLTCSESSGGCSYQSKVIASDGACDTSSMASITEWSALTTTPFGVDKTSGDGSFTVCARVRDGQGNVGEYFVDRAGDVIAQLDNTAPTISSISAKGGQDLDTIIADLVLESNFL